MNFSTVPPSASISSRIAPKYVDRTSWSRSGSRLSPRVVEPVTSANRIVTRRRSWPGGVGSATRSSVPQAGQNRASGGTSAPQTGHAATSEVPHDVQNRASSAFSVPHVGQGFTGASLRPGSDRRPSRRLARINVPEKPSIEGLEARWGEWWESTGTYRFDRTKGREDVYAIDTPAPTASGSLHIGHVFSYTHTDVIARFHRMRGKTVFYPIGWDDNGLATERRVQNYFGVRCDPSLPYDPDFDLDALDRPEGQLVAVSRPNFIELCERLTAEDEKAFEALFRLSGMSVDWN